MNPFLPAFQRLFFLTAVVTVAALGIPSAAHAATLAEWTLSSDLAPSNVAAGVTASNFVGGTVGADGAYASGWPTGGLSTADFFEVTLTAAAGQTISVTDVQFGERRSLSGPLAYDVQWSSDGFGTSTTLASVTVPDVDTERTGDLSGLTLTSSVGGTISIRWFGYNAESSGGTWRINDNTLKILGTIADVTTPTLAEVTPITSPTNNSTPSVTFSSTEAGTITTQGGCSSATTAATTGNNTITLNTLPDGTYATCQIRVTDAATNASNWLTLQSFTIDTDAPGVSSVSASSVADVTLTSNISVSFDEPMDQTVAPSISIGGLSSSPYTATCTWQSATTCTTSITLTDDGETAIGAITVSGGKDLAGNTYAPDSTGTISVDTENPVLTSLVIASNNADPALAKVGETITLTGTASEPLFGIWGQIFGRSASGNVAATTLSLAGTSTDPEGTVAFIFRCRDLNLNQCAHYTATTDGSSVTFDRTNPMLSSFQTTIASDSANSAYAKVGDTITLQFETNEPTQVPTGTILGHAVVPTSPDQKHWTVSHTATGTDSEGVVSFSYTIHDLAGNNSLTVTGTQDGSSVLFDRTAPDLSALTTLDLLGAESTGLKHRTKASFSWSGATDTGSGIATYAGALTHATLAGQTFAAQVGTTWTPTLLTPSDTPYALAITATDRAGNAATRSPAYTQRYSIGMSGIVNDVSGSPLDRATVQIVARYGEKCTPAGEICTATTDATGAYTIVINPGQSYTVNFYKNGYYLQKKDEVIGLVDHVSDASLAPITSRTDAQTLNSNVKLTCSVLLSSGSFGAVPTTVTVATTTGEVTTTPISGGFTVTSLGTISTVNSNNSAVTITDLGGNVWQVLGAGSVTFSSSLGATFDSSSTNRFGVIRVDGGDIKSRSGTPRGGQVMHGHFWTEDDSLSYLAQLDAGEFPAIITYRNRNGYEIFAGYQSGRLPITQISGPAKNKLQVRSAITAEQLAAAKERFQNVPDAPEQKRFEHVSLRQYSDAETILNRQARLAAIEVSNPFARHRAFVPAAGRLRAATPLDGIVLRAGGRTVSLQKVLGAETRRR